jgi:hypothetical protein
MAAPIRQGVDGENPFKLAIAGRQQEAALRQQFPILMEQSSRLEGKSTDLILMQPDKRLSRHDVVQGPD